MNIEFTENEKAVVEEVFARFVDTVQLIARLRGVKGARLAEDRSGLIVPDAPPSS